MAESPKQLPILTEKSRNKCHSNHFKCPPLTSLCTLTVHSTHNQVTETLLNVNHLNSTEVYLTHL